MSALGQKQTCAVHKLMSALPPIATAKADSRKRPCPLYPRKRTCVVQLGMSALGQKRTSLSSLNCLFFVVPLGLGHPLDEFATDTLKHFVAAGAVTRPAFHARLTECL